MQIPDYDLAFDIPVFRFKFKRQKTGGGRQCKLFFRQFPFRGNESEIRAFQKLYRRILKKHLL